MTNLTDFRFNDPLQRLILSTMYVLVGTLGILGNSMAIMAVLFSRKLHTISNVFVVNLSVADLMTSANLFGSIGQLLHPLGVQAGPDWMCVLVAVINYSCPGVSIITLASISLTRALVVTKPFLAARFSG